MSIYVIRHADKAYGDFHHKALKFNDQPITAIGAEKARKLVCYFDPIDIGSIHASGYLRTRQTIAHVCTSKGILPSIDHRLNEIDVGYIEDMPDEEVRKGYPEFWDAYISRDREFRMPGGESGKEAAARIRSLFDSLDTQKNHILVTHEGLIRILLCSVLGLPPYRRHLFRIDPCSLTVFAYDTMFDCWTVLHDNMLITQ